MGEFRMNIMKNTIYPQTETFSMCELKCNSARTAAPIQLRKKKNKILKAFSVPPIMNFVLRQEQENGSKIPIHPQRK